MKTKIDAKKMVIISDLHLGNPFLKEPQAALDFVKWAVGQGFDVCINGDGVEVAQASPKRLLALLPSIIRTMSVVKSHGRSVYYVLGNHDQELKHFLADWGHVNVSPCLDVVSAGVTVRVEHGHLYDPLYLVHPKAYEALTHWLGLFLKISPALYRGWILIEKLRGALRERKTGVKGEPLEFAAAAREIASRGYDHVVFGHTHHPGDMPLEGSKRYLNSGSWLFSRHYIEINEGVISLKQWDEELKVEAPGKIELIA